MNIKSTLIALTTAALLSAASTAAFAGPDVAPLNEEQYQVSAQGWLFPMHRQHMGTARMHMRSNQTGVGNLVGPADPHSGPSFDPDVE
ncbi:hypothetical protein GCM10007301_33740 [Azorhizobium oxalatiphilum]|uniref:Uncharacterized protein n=1 Tax=Azorhizobium oxalatiphilum TaxID=980631 RepID=A0A917FCU3_9HYPH|nr:hypothetical protein [Azorhizobium oxalatiphilum]GGF71258.1 hypothetical protein GCM10007301_33740 [Azorhizobium oxalatiphilum]